MISQMTEDEYKTLLESMVKRLDDEHNVSIDEIKSLNWREIKNETNLSYQHFLSLIGKAMRKNVFVGTMDLTKTVTNISKMTNKPKRPLSTGNIYVKKNFNKYQKQYPELDTKDVLKKLLNDFRLMSDEERAPYVAEHDNMRSNFKKNQFIKEVDQNKNRGIPLTPLDHYFLKHQESIDFSQLKEKYENLKKSKKLKYIKLTVEELCKYAPNNPYESWKGIISEKEEDLYLDDFPIPDKQSERITVKQYFSEKNPDWSEEKLQKNYLNLTLGSLNSLKEDMRQVKNKSKENWKNYLTSTFSDYSPFWQFVVYRKTSNVHHRKESKQLDIVRYMKEDSVKMATAEAKYLRERVKKKKNRNSATQSTKNTPVTSTSAIADDLNASILTTVHDDNEEDNDDNDDVEEEEDIDDILDDEQFETPFIKREKVEYCEVEHENNSVNGSARQRKKRKVNDLIAEPEPSIDSPSSHKKKKRNNKNKDLNDSLLSP
ncbi:hypothetical protein SNEBB_007581 [Seison nebaliae]|nr:hypothetical protein SNEBB_007581 [Seison nebaliae]